MGRLFILGTLLIVLFIGGSMVKSTKMEIDESSIGYALIRDRNYNQKTDINMLMSMSDKKDVEYIMHTDDVKITGVVESNAFKKSFVGKIVINGIVYDSNDQNLFIDRGEFEEQNDLYIISIGDEQRIINLYLNHEDEIMVKVYEASEYKNLALITSYFFDENKQNLEAIYEEFNLYA